jgi:hypothetical protein
MLAKGIMEWALQRDAVNFSHWFFPMRGMAVSVHCLSFCFVFSPRLPLDCWSLPTNRWLEC